jgi:hypothetical protein
MISKLEEDLDEDEDGDPIMDVEGNNCQSSRAVKRKGW